MVQCFEDDSDALEEWLSRTYPFLPADDPHQGCIRRAIAENVNPATVCTCYINYECDKECCAI